MMTSNILFLLTGVIPGGDHDEDGPDPTTFEWYHWVIFGIVWLIGMWLYSKQYKKRKI